MQNSFNWKKELFSDTYKVYSNNKQIGELKNRTFSQTSVGEINGKRYTFKTKGFFKQHTQIFDNSDNSLIGDIAYGNWMTKAFLSIKERKLLWKYNNAWNTKWSICESDRTLINYNGSSKGHIESDINDDLLLLTGLYVTNYYWQMTLFIIAAAWIPIYLASR